MRELLQIRRQSRAAQRIREPVTMTNPNLIVIPSKFHLTYLPFKGFGPLIKSGCAGGKHDIESDSVVMRIAIILPFPSHPLIWSPRDGT